MMFGVNFLLVVPGGPEFANLLSLSLEVHFRFFFLGSSRWISIFLELEVILDDQSESR